MKIALISGAFLLLSLQCVPQKNEKHLTENSSGKLSSSYFSELLVVMAIPIGDFASTDSLNSSSGYAGIGPGIFASYGKLFNNYVGMEVALGVSVFPLKNEIDEFKDIENAPVYQRGYGWWTISGLIGPCLSLPLNKFSFDFRALGGIINVIRPYFRNMDNTKAFRLEETVGNGIGFTWQLGVGLKYRLTNKIGLKISIDYSRAMPEVEYQESIASYNVYFHKEIVKFKQPISSFNCGIGMVINID